MKKIIIADVRSKNIEGKSAGHYFTVARNYREMFDGLCDVEIAGGPVYKNEFEDILILKYDTNPAEPILKQKRKILTNCFTLFESAGNNYLVMQSNAVATIYIALFLSGKRNNIYMIQYNLFSIDSRFKKILYGCVKRKICGVLCPTSEIGMAYDLPYCVIPDYCVTKETIEALPKKIETKKFDFGMVGLITHDKGIVEAARHLAGKEARVIIAGKPNDLCIADELKRIAASCGNIKLELGYISDEAYDSYIRQSRYCILNYTQAYSAHSSGVVFDVLYRGTPIVGRMCESLRFISENNMGYVYESIEDADFEKILSDCKDEDYLNNIRRYMEKQLTVPKRIYQFLEENKRY